MTLESRTIPYAVTRLDALRRLRREGYAVVDRQGYEQLRLAFADAVQIITMTAYSGSYEGEMLERMWGEAERWLDGHSEPASRGEEPTPENDPLGPMRDSR